MSIIKCKICGKEFEKPKMANNRMKYCSKKCKRWAESRSESKKRWNSKNREKVNKRKNKYYYYTPFGYLNPGGGIFL